MVKSSLQIYTNIGNISIVNINCSNLVDITEKND